MPMAVLPGNGPRYGGRSFWRALFLYRSAPLWWPFRPRRLRVPREPFATADARMAGLGAWDAGEPATTAGAAPSMDCISAHGFPGPTKSPSAVSLLMVRAILDLNSLKIGGVIKS